MLHVRWERVVAACGERVRGWCWGLGNALPLLVGNAFGFGAGLRAGAGGTRSRSCLVRLIRSAYVPVPNTQGPFSLHSCAQLSFQTPSLQAQSHEVFQYAHAVGRHDRFGMKLQSKRAGALVLNCHYFPVVGFSAHFQTRR